MRHDDQHHDQGDSSQDLRQGCNILTVLVHAIAAPLEVFLRVIGTFGSHAFGLHTALGLAAIIVLPVFLGVPGDYGLPVGFLLATVGLMIAHRIVGAWRERSGRVAHSRYTGWPWLCYLVPSLDEVKTKASLEPVLAAVAGFLVIALGNLPLGVWMVIAAVCLSASAAITQEEERARVRAMHDAMIEQSLFLDRFQGRR